MVEQRSPKPQVAGSIPVSPAIAVLNKPVRTMVNPVKAIQNLYFETVEEMKKCTWPTKKELVRSTGVVLTSLVILTVMVMVFDWVFQFAIRQISGMN